MVITVLFIIWMKDREDRKFGTIVGTKRKKTKDIEREKYEGRAQKK